MKTASAAVLDGAAASNPAPQNKLSTKAAGVVGAAVACSRVLGLVREQFFAHLFGAGYCTDVFVAAFRDPNLLRDLFAEGALSTAFITTFSKKIATEGDASAWRLANKMATLVMVFMSAVTLLGIVFAPQLIALVAGGFSSEKAAMTVELTRLMFPFIFMVSLAALVMGMLNAKNIFGMPAMASSFFNMGSIVTGISLAWWLEPHFGPRSLIGLGIGVLTGGLLQLGVQLPAVYRAGFRFRPDFGWRDDGVRQILLLMGPAVITASAVQVNVLVNGYFASQLGNGAVSFLNYAFRLMQLPIGIFGVAVGTVTLPVVSRFASANDLAGVRTTLGKGIRLAFLLTVPCAIGLIFLAEPIVSLIFERGRFSYASTLQTAAALKFYAAGLVAYSGIKVLAPAFYALDKRYAPMFVSFASIALNFVLNKLFVEYLHFSFWGLALSTSVVAALKFVTLYGLMVREAGDIETGALAKSIGKLVIASGLLVMVCAVAQHWLFANLEGMALLSKLISVFATIAAGVAVFGLAVYALKIEEISDVVAMIERKFAGKRRMSSTPA